MAPVGLLERESADDELLLLIREARRRQRRRRLRLALVAMTASLVAGLAAIAATDATTPAASLAPASAPGALAAAGCPTSPARFVSNSTFAATVLGRGPVRLAIGNVYLKARRRVVLGTTEARGWSAIEAIWIVTAKYHRSVSVTGKRFGKPGAIDLQSSDSGLAPGGAPLSLAPDSANTAPGLRLYPAAIWVRSAGCYALNVSGRGIREQIVLNAQAH